MVKIKMGTYYWNVRREDLSNIVKEILPGTFKRSSWVEVINSSGLKKQQYQEVKLSFTLSDSSSSNEIDIYEHVHNWITNLRAETLLEVIDSESNTLLYTRAILSFIGFRYVAIDIDYKRVVVEITLLCAGGIFYV